MHSGDWQMSLTLGIKSPDKAQRASQEKPTCARLRHVGRLLPNDSLAKPPFPIACLV
jgi:hypothetical protein